MFFPIKIDYWCKVWQALDQAGYDTLRSQFPGWPEEKPKYVFGRRKKAE